MLASNGCTLSSQFLGKLVGEFSAHHSFGLIVDEIS